jgi:uncharacterized DUF497 family protein
LQTRFQWDERKDRRNAVKHGFPIEVAVEVFQDPLFISIEDFSQSDETKYRAFGRIRNWNILLLVYSVAEQGDVEVIRIISARKATTSERRLYETQS